MIIYENLYEALRLSDLMKDAGISNLTKKFKKSRSKILGNETRVVKLIDATIDEKLDFVTFIFLTEVTPYPQYPKNYKYKQTKEKNYDIEKNTSKIYEEHIQIVDFFKWLSTNPDKNEITRKDIKEILEVSDIKLFCNCVSFNYQGMAYKLSTFDSAIYKQGISDKVWGIRHNDDNLTCKHLSGLINSIKFWYNPMASMLTKKLKDRKII